MLKVECESCKAPYQVDERRVPPTGLKMRCPKCGHTFLVTDPSKGARPADGSQPKPSAKRSTMLGLAPKPISGGGRAAAPTGVDPAAMPPKPAIRPVAAKAGGPGTTKPTTPAMSPLARPHEDMGARAAKPAFENLDLPVTGNRAPSTKAVPAAPATKPFDLEMPSGFGSIDLPAPKHGPPTSKQPAKAAPSAFGAIDLPGEKDEFGGIDPFGDIDLLSTKGGFGDVDRPVPKGQSGFGNVDLPMAKGQGDFGDVDLPMAKGQGFGDADLPMAKGQGRFGDADLPMSKGQGFGDVDLPIAKRGGGAAGGLDLPSAKRGGTLDPPSARGSAAGSVDSSTGGGGGAHDRSSSPRGGFGEINLPSGKGEFAEIDDPSATGGFGDIDLPMAKRGGFGDVDLPMAKGQGFGDVDLPMPKARGFGDADLPSVKRGGFGDVDLPEVKGFDLPIVQKAPSVAKTNIGGFGEIDLPSLQNDLPQSIGQAELPSPASPHAHLPSPAGAHAHLPSPASPHAHLPSPAGAHAHLPAAMNPNDHLPLALGATVQLPAPASPHAHLPSPLGTSAQMPLPVSDDRLLPNGARGRAAPPPSPASFGPAPIAFGELDLPLVGTGDDPFHNPSAVGPPPPRQVVSAPPDLPPALGGFGEVDLPGDPGPVPTPSALLGAYGSQGNASPTAGGMAFGEVDLGGGSAPAGSIAPIGPPPATSAGSFAFQEASLDAAAAPRADTRPKPPPPTSKAPKIVALGLVLLVIGGAALQLTPVGAFGYVWINDRLHAGENVAQATAKGDATRKKLALDTFAAAQSAADELVDARKRAPRSRPLGAYTAFVEYMNQVRFGLDPARAGRVSAYLTEIQPNTEVPYLHAARAAQSAQAGDWAKAKTAVDLAIAKEPKDGIQHDLSILKGEIALAQKDATSALAAFNAANASGASARTSFGIARAQYLAKALPKAREAVDIALKTSPTHAGALTLRAQITWELQRDEAAAMKDLDTVLDAKNRKALGASEVASALAVKGWILLSRDRAADARATFDEAVKVDPRNVAALVGQGEVLYADSRYTEALTRFDDAVGKDPTSIAAVIGSAKTKISLENLAEAKAQLSAARQRAPKDMNVALWLARVEEGLANKKLAEELYATAIDLADPQNPDAIQAYAVFAKFLASQGRKADAAAKLEQARTKLPESAALHRAFGEVAVEQGHFQEALDHFEAALKMNPSDLGTRFRLGVTYRRMHKLDLAAKALDEVAAIEKDYPGLALERGLLFEESGDIQKALEQFQSASQKAPNDPDLKLRVGAAYVAIGDVEKALPLLTQVREVRPNSAEVNHFIGRAYLKQGGLEAAQAMRYLQRAVALDGNKAEYHLYVAWAANEASTAQLGLARTHIEKALELDKLLADAYWQRGVLLRKEGQVNDAIKDLKRALELKPSRHEAHAALAEAYEEKNDLGAAAAEWQKAIAGDEKPPLWRWKYGKLLAGRNHNADATKHLVYAVEHGKSAQPRPAWLGTAAFEAGEVLRKTGQKKEACEHYHLFLDLAPPSAPDRRDAMKAQSDLGCPSE